MKKFKKDSVNYDEKLTNSSEEDISMHVTRKTIKLPTYVDEEIHQYPCGNFQMAQFKFYSYNVEKNSQRLCN